MSSSIRSSCRSSRESPACSQSAQASSGSRASRHRARAVRRRLRDRRIGHRRCARRRRRMARRCIGCRSRGRRIGGWIAHRFARLRFFVWFLYGVRGVCILYSHQRNLLLHAVFDGCDSLLLGTVRATKHPAACLHPVADDRAIAVLTSRGQRGDRAFKAVEKVRLPVHRHFKRIVIIVSAFFADCLVFSHRSFRLPVGSKRVPLKALPGSCRTRMFEACRLGELRVITGLIVNDFPGIRPGG